jgi:hypothetical protein
MCCGQYRSSSTGHVANASAPHPPAAAIPPPQRRTARFQYVGSTAATVVGSATGQPYRFERTGSVLDVDARDQPSLAVVPCLRQV